MRIIHLPRVHFDEIYWRLSAYVDHMTTPDQCLEDALNYIKENDILNLNTFEEVDWMQGYRLIRPVGHYYETGAVRSIWINPEGNKIFYEGILSIRKLDEFKFFDYMFLDREDIETLKRKYELYSEHEIKEFLENNIFHLEKKIGVMEKLCPKHRNLPNFKGELNMCKKFHEKFVKKC